MHFDVQIFWELRSTNLLNTLSGLALGIYEPILKLYKNPFLPYTFARVDFAPVKSSFRHDHLPLGLQVRHHQLTQLDHPFPYQTYPFTHDLDYEPLSMTAQKQRDPQSKK